MGGTPPPPNKPNKINSLSVYYFCKTYQIPLYFKALVLVKQNVQERFNNT